MISLLPPVCHRHRKEGLSLLGGQRHPETSITLEKRREESLHAHAK